MSYRELRDDHGRLWQVWNTVPTSVAGALAEGFAEGWLTFECDLEKRRLAPIPPGWDEATDERLRVMLAAASPVHRLNRAARAVRDSEAAAPAAQAPAAPQPVAEAPMEATDASA
jgi:hypothetical protein